MESEERRHVEEKQGEHSEHGVREIPVQLHKDQREPSSTLNKEWDSKEYYK